MEKAHTITNLVLYTDTETKDNETLSAIINGEQHCTADVRGYGTSCVEAVFSQRTRDIGFYNSVMECVKLKMYEARNISLESWTENYFIYVILDLEEKTNWQHTITIKKN
jgi:hypothetical protein